MSRQWKTPRYKAGRAVGFGAAFIAAFILVSYAPAYKHGLWPWLLFSACMTTGRMTGVLAAFPAVHRQAARQRRLMAQNSQGR